MAPTSRITLVLVVGAMLLPSPRALAVDEEGDVVELLVESADTPREHQALAEYFRDLAAERRVQAARHRSMARHYGGEKATLRQLGKEHCDRLVGLYEQEAAEYDALAKMHDTQAAE